MGDRAYPRWGYALIKSSTATQRGDKMTIDKAIELLTYSSEQNTMLITGDEKDALKLGIEALTFCQNYKQLMMMGEKPLLTGED